MKDGVGNLKLLVKRENTELAQLGGPRDCVLCEFHVWGISGELNQVLLTAMGLNCFEHFGRLRSRYFLSTSGIYGVVKRKTT